MNVAVGAEGLLDGLRRLSPPDRLLRLVGPAATVVFAVLLALAGGGFHPVLVTVALLLSLLGALIPDGSAPLFLVLYLVALWGLTVPGPLDALVLVAALDLVALHVAATLSSYGPAGLRLAGRLVRTWSRRALDMAATAGLVWLAGHLLGVLDAGATPAVVVGLAVLVAWVVFLLWRLGLLGGGEDAP